MSRVDYALYQQINYQLSIKRPELVKIITWNSNVLVLNCQCWQGSPEKHYLQLVSQKPLIINPKTSSIKEKLRTAVLAKALCSSHGLSAWFSILNSLKLPVIYNVSPLTWRAQRTKHNMWRLQNDTRHKILFVVKLLD